MELSALLRELSAVFWKTIRPKLDSKSLKFCKSLSEPISSPTLKKRRRKRKKKKLPKNQRSQRRRRHSKRLKLSRKLRLSKRLRRKRNSDDVTPIELTYQ